MKRSIIKLGVYTKAHGFLSVPMFEQAQKKGLVPIRGSLEPTKPEQVGAVEYRRKGYNKH